MKKFVMLGILLMAMWGMAQTPSNYTIPYYTGTAPTVDGNVGEWTDANFIDSLRSDDNIICRDALTPWDRADFQYMVYAMHDGSKVYFGLKLIADDVTTTGTGTGCDDAFKVNPGGKATAFYMFHSSGTIVVNPSCPYAQGSTLFATLLPTGNGNLCTAEFSLDLAVLDPFGMGEFQLSVGMEEGDTPTADCMDTKYGGIGIYYAGNKQDWASNPWDNPMYYPKFTLAPVKVESKVTAKAAEMLTASPNPFVPATTLSYNVKNSGSLKIFDMAGKVVKSFAVKAGTGSVEWNAGSMASGIYVARLVSGKSTLNTRLFLTR